MSARALRKLREDREIAQKPDLDDVDEDEEEEEDSKPSGGAFLAMMDSDSSDEEESDEEESDADKQNDGKEIEKEARVDDVARVPAQETEDSEEEEDLDAILAEFDDETDLEGLKSDVESEALFGVITSGLDFRDMDLEYVQRTHLLGGGPSDAPPAARRSRQLLFGPAKEGWGRPPHYVGGGMGMTSYDQSPAPLPWPYDASEELKNPKLWFAFQQSDTYHSLLEQYRQIQQSGDVNALCLFVADNPFCPEALLQLARVVYQTNNSAEAQALLRRALYVYESAAIKSFAPNFMDCDLPENSTFFQSLFLLTQVSSIAGCMRTALSVSRYMLAMDPLRDPKGVLLSMDHFALSTMSHDLFLVDLVERGDLKVAYRDSESREFECELMGMPNWAYSYALALYRLEQTGGKSDSTETETVTSMEALVSAVRKFPAVVEELLRKNDISMTGRSTRTDWPTVLEKLRQHALPPSKDPNYDPIVYHASKSAADVVVKIFVQRSFKLWSGSDVQKWLYDACIEATSDEDQSTVELPSPALQRYAQIDPADFEDRFRLLPQEANPLDMGLLQYALNVDPNRRRLLRRGNRGAGEIDPLEALEQRARGQQGIVLGGPPTHTIDPDDPLVEVLWRSMMPWNHVEGVPPPRR